MDQQQGQTSPIRAWMQKHSPLKSRNKPLPPAPSEIAANDHDESRRRLHATSNVTPPRRTTLSRSSKLRSLLTSKHSPGTGRALRPSPPALRDPSSLQSLRQSASSAIHKSYRGRGHKSPDLKKLSRKVSDLEAELQRARREIRSVSRQGSRSNSVEREREADLQRLRKWKQQATLPSGGPAAHDGLVENLLRMSEVDRRYRRETLPHSSDPRSGDNNDHMARPDSRSITKEENYIDERAHSETQLTPASLKRKRSELRQESWGRIQRELHSKNASNELVHHQQPQGWQPFNPRQINHSRRASTDGTYHRANSRDGAVTQSISALDSDMDQTQPRKRAHLSTLKNQDGRLNSSTFDQQKALDKSLDKSLPKVPLEPGPELARIPRFSPPTSSIRAKDPRATIISENWTLFPADAPEPRSSRHGRRHSEPQLIKETQVELSPEPDSPATASIVSITEEPLSRSPSKARHRRRQSLVIARDDVEALRHERGSEKVEERRYQQQQHRRRQSRALDGDGGGEPSGASEHDNAVVLGEGGHGPQRRGRRVSDARDARDGHDDDDEGSDGKRGSLPPSPRRRACPAPRRLAPVAEEFEWPDDVF